MNQIDQLFSQHPNLTPAVIDGLIAKAIAGIEADIREIENRQQKAAEDFLAGFEPIPTTVALKPEPKAASPESEAPTAWSHLTHEQRSAQMKLRWVKRRQNKASAAFELLQRHSMKAELDPLETRVLNLVCAAMSGTSTPQVADAAMRKAAKAVADWKGPSARQFRAVVQAWGSLT